MAPQKIVRAEGRYHFRSSEPTRGHPDFALVRAVAEGAITPDEAELIGSTRLEDYPLTRAAADIGVNITTLERHERHPATRAWQFAQVSIAAEKSARFDTILENGPGIRSREEDRVAEAGRLHCFDQHDVGRQRFGARVLFETVSDQFSIIGVDVAVGWTELTRIPCGMRLTGHRTFNSAYVQSGASSERRSGVRICQHRPHRSTEFGSGSVGEESGEEGLDAAIDVVADRPDLVHGLSGGVVELPVEVAFAGEDRAGVAAAHRDDHVGGLDGFGGQRFGKFFGQVEPDFVHGLGHRGVDGVGGRGPGGADGHLALGVVVE